MIPQQEQPRLARRCINRIDSTIKNTRQWFDRPDWSDLDSAHRAKVCKQTAKDLHFYIDTEKTGANNLIILIGTSHPHLQLELLRVRHEALSLIDKLEEMAPVLEATARLLAEPPL